MQRALQIAEDALGINAVGGLDRQSECFTSIIHCQRKRITRTLMHIKPSYTPPGIMGQSRIVRRTVTEVEQCAEQRSWGRHAAAALRQGQRGVLVFEQTGQARMHLRDCLNDGLRP
ncbi:hypothetical protein PFLU3_57170 [Pseudomonas fluorescens]|uniref:Uncharacterized protein n=1 Tax=Pseudomonas fluorescens TaxID=294 RepID=A0A0D0RUZ1_PSEFL|nr:hypothetical protein PFLU3_57170 [Pseudomonas fluorescens]